MRLVFLIYSMGKTFSFSPRKNKKHGKNNGSSPSVMKSVKESVKSTPSRIRVSKSVEKISHSVQSSPHIVEFEIDGVFEKLGVYESIGVIEPSDGMQFTLNNDINIQTPTAKGTARAKSKKSKSAKRTSEKNRNLTMQLSKPDLSPIHDSDPNLSLAQKVSHRGELPKAEFDILKDFEFVEAPKMPSSYIQHVEKSVADLAEEVEYDLDEVDCEWLKLFNEKRKRGKLVAVDPDIMEFLMDRFEKEAFVQIQATGIQHSPPIDDDAVCCVCLDGECQNSNVILFCDMCNMAIHQECYGVPYIPEGQWLCRRCLQSPDAKGTGICELCPNKLGAFKQTPDGKWAHIICAIWIPEVCFGNTVFLEPIDGIINVPAARWRLTCFICKQKGIGACIQCHKSNCYKAFHVTCAQQANLVMTIDTIKHNSTVVVKKTAWCDLHAPPGSERKLKEIDYSSSSRQKLKETRKLLAEKRDATPTVTFPSIPADRIAGITRQIKVAKKRQFVERLMAYWKLKRQSRNGVPLLRRLQVSTMRTSPNVKAQRSRAISTKDVEQVEEQPVPSSSNPYREWLKIRQDLEKVRLLSELVRKREQLKLSDIRTRERISDLTLRPFNMFLKGLVDEMMRRDTDKIFGEPVDTKKVPSYCEIVTFPMDLGTMREKAASYDYSSIDELEQDFSLMIDNCITFNDEDTIYYKAALKMREVGEVIITQGRIKAEAIGFDAKTGLHFP